MLNEYEKDPGWQYLRHSREKLLEFQSKPYDSKKDFWVPDAEEGYLASVVKETKGDNVIVTANGTDRTVKKDLLQEMNPSKFEMNEDMSNLSFLNDASVLHNLRSRYATMLIYTYSGLFCVVINPYKRLPIYTDSMARIFMGKRRNEMPPHLFAVSDEAYRNMLQNHDNQSMLITGESGAGKTENTKKVISYFASVGAAQAEALGIAPKADEGGKKVTLEDQIVQTNPVLEAFGNAKTVRNNNSSRFGKFIRIHFNKVGRVASCDIEHYLLEKSRVIRQAPGERCYHIFYQIFSDFKPELKDILKFTKPLPEYWFVAQAELTIDGMNDTEEFALTDEAFDVLNFSADEKLDCYKLMSGIMHMGNMKFKQRPREEQAEVDETEEAGYAAEMFGVNADEMLTAMIKPKVRVGTEWVAKGQSVEQVNWSIGAMVKGLYARVFHWLVTKCNMTLDQKGLSRDHFIGVLDIAGFEIFDFNSFEQLWINFVNEKLQQFFNHHMFVLEQEEYAREGIQWTFIDFGLDLQACIELIEKPMGIISMLDEECIVPKASDQTLAQKLLEQHLGKHPNFEKPKPPKGKQAEAHFAMRHYAGTVRYNVSNWLEKNKDPLNDTLVSVFKNSKERKLLNTIWSDYQTQEEAAVAQKTGGKKKGKSGSFMTVSMMYRESLNKLMTMLHTTHPHFIRCIIPNEKKQSGMIDASLVLNQLTCNGVLEGIRICRKGFPNRSSHGDFCLRYSVLAGQEAREHKEPKNSANAILQKLVNLKKMEADEFRVGHTKVFFKAGILAKMEDLRDERMNELISGIQAYCRGYLGLVEYGKRKHQADAYLVIQKNIRSWSVLRSWEWYKVYGFVRPMLKGNKIAEEMEKAQKELAAMAEQLKKEEESRKKVEAEHKKFAEERAKLMEEMELSKSGGAAIEDKISSLSAAKAELERGANDLKDRLADQEARTEETLRQVKRVEKDKQNMNEQISSLESSQQKIEDEKKEREEKIRSLHDAMAKQDEAIAALNREKKRNEEENRAMAENLQAEEEKNSQSNRSKVKIERSIEDIEDTLERERRHRMDLDKGRKKAENELAATEENIDEISRRKAEIENKLQTTEEELRELNQKLDEEQGQVARLNRQLKEQASKIIELEEELDSERHHRAKSDKSKGAIQMMLEDINDSLDDENGKTTAQIELNKKKELELIRLRQELEQANQNHEGQLALIRKKNADDISNLSERLENMQNSKAKVDKDKDAVRRQLDDVTSQVNEETKNKSEQERLAKMYEGQVAELQSRCDEQHRLIQDYTATRSRLQAENSDMEQQIEDYDTQLTALSKRKAQCLAQLEDAKRTVDEEHQERQSLSGTVKNLEHEIEHIHDCIEDEAQQKEELLRQLSKAKAESQQWKAKFEGEGLIAADEMEEDRRRRGNKKLEVQDTLQDVNNKIITVEKANSRLIQEAEDARSDMERNRALIAQLEKKQLSFDRIIEDWRRQCDELAQETERAQQEARRSSADVYSLQTASTSLTEQVDDLRRENKNLTNEIKDLNEQSGASNRQAHDVGKKVRLYEMEKEEIQHNLDETESALEVEESKVLRLQTEVSQIRAEIDRRIQEKEEDFENTLKNHQRAMESIQTSLETESKGKNQLLQAKKKLETDIHERELALDVANKQNLEAQKSLKKLISQVQELQAQLEEEQRQREEFRENFLIAEKKLLTVLTEKDEQAVHKKALEQQKSKLDADVNEQRSIRAEAQNENLQLAAVKRQAENEIQIVKSELDKAISDLKHTEETFKKVNGDVTRLTEELRQEQAHFEHLDRLRKGLDLQIKELQAKLEEAEQGALRVSQRTIEKLEQNVRMRERELDSEQKRHKEVQKQLAKYDRDVRERKFELEEQKKSAAKMQELIEKLQSKIKTHKKQLEEAEEVAGMNLQKYRQIQIALDHAEERADEAENSLVRIKTKFRGRPGIVPSATQPINGTESNGIRRSATQSQF